MSQVASKVHCSIQQRYSLLILPILFRAYGRSLVSWSAQLAKCSSCCCNFHGIVLHGTNQMEMSLTCLWNLKCDAKIGSAYSILKSQNFKMQRLIYCWQLPFVILHGSLCTWKYWSSTDKMDTREHTVATLTFLLEVRDLSVCSCDFLESCLG